jgi:hypothetical protein
MSSAGTVPAWVIEKQRVEIERKREAERRNRVRKQITQVCSEIQTDLSNLTRTGNAAWATEEISEISNVLEKAKSIDEGDVDYMLRQVSESRSLARQIEEISKSRKEEHAQTLDRKASKLESLQNELKFIKIELDKKENIDSFSNLTYHVEDMVQKMKFTDESELDKFIDETRKSAEQLRIEDNKSVIEEELRRHIVSSIINSMNELGFVVGKPKLVKESGKVAIIGKLSSGRHIRFDVTNSGQMEFDMEGFVDRKCADHLDEVLATLEKNFGVESGPVQHNWKNPDRISKGSKGFPTGGNTRSLGGGNR